MSIVLKQTNLSPMSQSYHHRRMNGTDRLQRREPAATGTPNPIISFLPTRLELSNEHIVHNKVQIDSSGRAGSGLGFIYNYRAQPPTLMRLIPRGKKALLWLRKGSRGIESVVIFKENDKYGYSSSGIAAGSGGYSGNSIEYFTRFVPSHVQSFFACFNPLLTAGRYGTILYGSLVLNREGTVSKIFAVEDILAFKGTLITPAMASWNDRLALIMAVINNTRPVGYIRSCAGEYEDTYHEMGMTKDIVLMTPITVPINYEEGGSGSGINPRKRITRGLEDAFARLSAASIDVPYTGFAVQLIRGEDYSDIYSNAHLVAHLGGVGAVAVAIAVTSVPAPALPPTSTPKANSTSITTSISASITTSNPPSFYVKPDIREDIYHLYSDKDCTTLVGTANICDYKTSVMMNGLFRNIKENANLDALEESDDEDEFQNVREDKYVHLDKVLLMNCEYSAKFRSWIPRSVVG